MSAPRRLKNFLRCTAVSVLLLATTALHAAPRTEADERLLATARLWRDVKLYHLAVARGEVDWDAALVASLPAIRAATTPAQFHAAIDGLMASLQDPLTRGGPAQFAPPVELKPAQPVVEWLAGDIALLHVHDNAAIAKLRTQTDAITARAKGVILDLRPSAAGPASQSIDEFIARLIDKPLTLPTLRYLAHSGYAPVRGDTSGGYQTTLATDLAKQLLPAARGHAIPIVFLIDNRVSPPLSALALQRAGQAWIVATGALAPLPRPVEIDEKYTVRFSAGELVFEDGSTPAGADVEIKADPRSAPDSPAVVAALDVLRKAPAVRKTGHATALPIRQIERPYAEMRFPELAWRQLAVVKLWAVMDAFFPYKTLMDRSWNEALPLFFKRMETVTNAQEYALAIAEMTTWLQDSHVYAYSAELNRYFGTADAGIKLSRIEDKIVVTGIASPELPGRGELKVGDVLLAVDGEDAQRRLERLQTVIAGSTPWYRDVTSLHRLTGGPSETTAKLRVVAQDGTQHEVALERKRGWTWSEKTDPVFRVLDENVGYVDLTGLEQGQVGAMFEAVKNTRALILDMRGYPRGVFWLLARGLNVNGAPTAAKFARPLRRALSPNEERFQFDQPLAPAGSAPYRGQLVMLINEQAISQSEHTALFVEAAAPVTFIGSPTAGADGDITNTVLPGDIMVSFSGHEVRHADGRQLQRVGIQPHILAKPTIAGIRTGRDEVLERALEFVKNGR
ncbi:S41 family peptidase [Massilia horti]|nr:S41 family peptidase [Massilia horti]